MAQMVGAKLSFKAVFGLAKRSGHDACVGDDYVKGLTLGDQGIGAGADILQVGKVELDEFETSAIRGCVFPDLLGGALRLVQVADSANYIRAVRRQGTGGFNSDAGGCAGYENALAAK